jgi:hypothetical protein
MKHDIDRDIKKITNDTDEFIGKNIADIGIATTKQLENRI